MGGIPIWRSTRTVTSKDDQNKVLTIGEQFKRAGVSHRDFLKFWAELMVAAPVGFAFTQKSSAGEVVQEIAENAAAGRDVAAHYELRSPEVLVEV